MRKKYTDEKQEKGRVKKENVKNKEDTKKFWLHYFFRLFTCFLWSNGKLCPWSSTTREKNKVLCFQLPFPIITYYMTLFMLKVHLICTIVNLSWCAWVNCVLSRCSQKKNITAKQLLWDTTSLRSSPHSVSFHHNCTFTLFPSSFFEKMGNSGKGNCWVFSPYLVCVSLYYFVWKWKTKWNHGRQHNKGQIFLWLFAQESSSSLCLPVNDTV